jgi:hypothetical protein
MFEALAKLGLGAMEIAAGEFLAEWSCTCGNAVEFHGCAGRIAGDLEGLRGANGCEGEQRGESRDEAPRREEKHKDSSTVCVLYKL